MVLLVLFACKPNQVSITPVEVPVVPQVSVIAGEEAEEWGTFEREEDGMHVVSGSETFALGDRYVGISVYQKGTTGLTFVNVHDDEVTSVYAARRVIDALGGKIIRLRHTGERNLKFGYNGRRYEVDPNRIFTDFGAKETMLKHGPYTAEGHQLVRKLAQIIVDSLSTEIIFTLHNNTPDNYSARSYLDEYANEAADVYLNPSRDPDDFFFVTERMFFEQIKAEGFNVVLQNNHGMTDDGSLSVLAAMRGLPYINIEAEHGHIDEQEEMLKLMYRLFR